MDKLVRKAVANLSLPGPMARSHEDHFNLSLRDNEQPFGGEYARYPSILQSNLKQQYLDVICALDSENNRQYYNLLNANNVLFTTGAVDGLDLIFKTFFEPREDAIILNTPYFGVFEHWAKMYDVEVIDCPLRGEYFELLPLDDITACQSKGIILCDPNNPMGSRIHPDDIRALAESYNGLIIIDEAYVEYDTKGSNISLITQYENIIILRTMSKALGMAGLRVGAVMANSKTMDFIKRVQPPFNVPMPVIKSLEHEFSNKDKLIDAIDKVRQLKDDYLFRLNALTCVKKIFPSVTSFFNIEFSNASAVHASLENAGIKVVWNPEGIVNHARISIGTFDENEQVLNCLKQCC
jgi:histidinol-phosphate aminotransferase